MKTAEILIPSSELPDFGGSRERDPLFRARGLTKVYASGEIEVRTLDGVDLGLFEATIG
jgi:hypothetical protein